MAIPIVRLTGDTLRMTTSPPVQIRRANPEADIGTIMEHRLRMFAEMGYGQRDAVRHIQRGTKRYLRHALRSDRYRAWLAVDESGAAVAGAGLIVANWPGTPRDGTGRRAWILNVFVEPRWRRRGIARRLVQEIVSHCRSEGFASVSLHASADGRQLYESLGFCPTNEMRLQLHQARANPVDGRD
jgi:GNAT superfamily N-acetyltransferase